MKVRYYFFRSIVQYISFELFFLYMYIMTNLLCPFRNANIDKNWARKIHKHLIHTKHFQSKQHILLWASLFIKDNFNFNYFLKFRCDPSLFINIPKCFDFRKLTPLWAPPLCMGRPPTIPTLKNNRIPNTTRIILFRSFWSDVYIYYSW